MASVEQAQAALNAVQDAGSGRSLIELGWIQQTRLVGDRAVFRLALPGFAQSQRDRIAAEAKAALLALEGINDVQIELEQPSGGAPIGAAGHGHVPERGQLPERQAIPGVRQVIAVSKSSFRTRRSRRRRPTGTPRHAPASRSTPSGSNPTRNDNGPRGPARTTHPQRHRCPVRVRHR